MLTHLCALRTDQKPTVWRTNMGHFEQSRLLLFLSMLTGIYIGEKSEDTKFINCHPTHILGDDRPLSDTVC